MRNDYAKFANRRFLKTVHWPTLGRLLEKHRARLPGLDLDALTTGDVEVREAVASYLLRSKDMYPKSLVQDLHRIVRLDSPLGMRLLQEEADRQGVVIIDPEERPTPIPRDYALAAFVDFPDVFEEAEKAEVFTRPNSVTEYDAGEDSIAPSVTRDTIEAFRIRTSEIFAAALRGRYCHVRPYEDGEGERCFAVRHGAPPISTEVVRGEGDEVIGLQEVDTAVLSFVEATGRLTVWGCSKKYRGDLAEAFAAEILGRPGTFKAASAQEPYTLAPAERAKGAFRFRWDGLNDIERVDVIEAQANRVVTNPRTGKDRTLFWLRSKDPGGDALALLHASRGDIEYGDNNWRLDHIIARVVLKSEGGRDQTVGLTIKPPGTATFPRTEHKKLIEALLQLNRLTTERYAGATAMAAE